MRCNTLIKANIRQTGYFIDEQSCSGKGRIRPVKWNWKRTPKPHKSPDRSQEEKIRQYTEQVAQELYQNRLLLGRPGDAQSDWETAEKIVRSPWRTTLFASNRPLIKLEKHCIEPASKHLKGSALFDIVERMSPALEAIGVLLIPVAIWWFSESSQAAKEEQERQTRAQEAVKTYLSQLSDVFLNGELEKDENLRIVTRASTLALLRDPNMDGDRKGQVIEYLTEMNLVNVKETEESVDKKQGTEVQAESLISLADANLFDALLSSANLSNSDLELAELSFADLSDADLSSAKLNSADLSSAKLNGAKLNGADLTFADLSGAIVLKTDLSTARNLIQEQLEGENSPYLCEVKLPPHITIDPDRDCKQLPTILQQRYPEEFKTIEEAQHYIDSL